MTPQVAFLLLGETLLVPHLFPIVEALASDEAGPAIDVWVSNEAVHALLRPWTADLAKVRLRRAPVSHRA